MRFNPRTRRKPREGTICGYCFDRMATGFDHLIPISYRVDNSNSNLYPACIRCNRLAGSMIFDSVEEKRDYVRKRLKERGEWTEEETDGDRLPELRQDDTTEEIMAKVLWPIMPVGEMGERAPKNLKFGESTCEQCGVLFALKSKTQKFCGLSCRSIYHAHKMEAFRDSARIAGTGIFSER